MFEYLGHLAAIGTSFAWSFTSVFFTQSGRLVGSEIVNRTRLLLAVVFVGITHRILQGQFFPLGAEPFRYGWMALSGIIGYVIGDSLLFQAFVMVGPRLSMLLMALAPVISTLLAWVFLGEKLSALELTGIAMTVSGVMLVVADRSGGKSTTDTTQNTRHYIIGLLFGLGGALGQAGGLLASRMGLVGDFPALSGNLIRVVTAASVIWLITLVRGRARENFQMLRANPKALRGITIGAIFGPFGGVWLSLIAVQNAPLGIASTLMSLTPIILLPVGRIFFKDRITGRAILGTVVAFTGTALLFL
jgi:drug/metabolite transporter (DMT)-like permease